MKDSSIADVAGRRVWDSRGRPTVEVTVTLADGAEGRAIAPAGASTGSGEAVDLRDGGDSFGGYDVRRALAAELSVRASWDADASGVGLVGGTIVGPHPMHSNACVCDTVPSSARVCARTHVVARTATHATVCATV